ncbi:hypothetical protein HDU99_008613 [Rhizoclosmatium hyalinum]|nr:hypothetical protein HDU99_008613 [Rhizoclosmatium hyalinum]
MIQASPTTSGKQTLEELVKNSPGKKLVDMIDAAANNYSEYEPKLNEALEQFTASIPGVSDVASSLSQGLKSLESIITNVADMVKNAADLDIKFVELVTAFDNTSGHIRIVMTAEAGGMSEAVSDFVVQGINDCMKCTIQLVQLCLEHDNQNKVARFVFAGSAIDKFKTMKESLDVSASELREKLVTANFVNILALMKTHLANGTRSAGKAEILDPLSFISYRVNGSVAPMQKLSKESTKGTRVWLLDEIEEQFSSIEVYCLRGEAGVGKSVISGCLGKRLQDFKQLKAAFFCKSEDANRNNLVALIQNVAHQLAHANPEFYNALIEAHKVFYQQFKREPASVVELLDNYIVIPLSKWPENEPCFVILDALDELLSNSSLIKDIGTLLTKFSASKKVKLFVTTRTDKASMEQISPDRLTAIIRDFPHENKDNQHNLKDIKLFATTQLESTLGKKVSDADIATLANFFKEKSNGLFIWAAMALNLLSLTETYKNIKWIASNSTQRMELLKMELQEIAKLGLYDFYTLAFERAYPPNEDKKYFQAAIGFVLHAKVPVSLKLIASLVPEFDGLPNSENPSLQEIFAVRDYVERCSSLLYNDDPDSLNGKLHFIHKTVREYLSDEKTLFSIDGQSVSVQIAKTYLKRFCGNKVLFKNMGKLTVTASESYSGSNLPEELVYGLQYWHLHFIEALSGDCAIEDKKELIRLFVKFCEEKLVYYLEALVLLGKLNDIPRLVVELTKWLKAVKFELVLEYSPLAAHEILSLLNDLKFVAVHFYNQLLVSPLQVYNHALIAVPQETMYYRLYQGLATARITIGAEKEWGPFTFVGHSESVCSVAFSPDGKTVVSGSDDRTVRLWSVETGECFTLVGHSDWVTSVAVSPDSKTVVSGSGDKKVNLWDVKTGELSKTLGEHSHVVRSVAFLPSGKTVVSGSYDQTVKLWDVKQGKCIDTRSWDGSDLTEGFFASELTVQDGWICQGKTLVYYPNTEIDVFSESSAVWTVNNDVFCLTLNK